MTSNDQPRRSDRHRPDYDDYDYNNDEPRHGGLVKRILLWILGIIILLFVAGTALFFYYASSAPRISRSELAGQSTTTIYDDQSRIISRLGAQKREYAKSDQVPDAPSSTPSSQLRTGASTNTTGSTRSGSSVLLPPTSSAAPPECRVVVP